MSSVGQGGATAGDAATIIAVTVAFVALLAGFAFQVFRKQFIAERAELAVIRDSSARLRHLADSLSAGFTALVALTEFQGGVIERLLAHLDTGMDDSAFGEQVLLLRGDVVRCNNELLLLTGDLVVAESAARHLSNSAGTVGSLRLLDWVVSNCDDSQARSRLQSELRRLETRLDEGGLSIDQFRDSSSE